MSKKRKETLRIHFIDGKQDVVPQKLYDDYEYFDGNFAVIRKQEWIALYNMDIVSKILVGKVEKEYSPKKHGIRLFFKSGRRAIIPRKRFTGYDYVDGYFVVKRGEQWIAIYRMNDIACIGIG